MKLTETEKKALRAGATWALNGDGFLDDWMKAAGCGRNWHSHLRRAVEKLAAPAPKETN